MPKVIVAILNWNGRKHLQEFLPGVVANSSNAEVVIIDNASSDDSVTYLQKHFPEVKIIQLPFNMGFAGGYNEGLKQLESDYFVLLNSDVEVTPDWILPVVNLMESDLNIAAAQPAIGAFLRQTHFEHAGAAGGFIDKDLYPFCRGRMFNHTEEDQKQYRQSTEIFWATGACMFVRSSAFREVNGFDHDFFAHMEEIDLCYRLKNRGYAIWFCADAKVFHLGGGTLAYESPGKTYLNFRNNLWLIHKNYYEGNLFFSIFRRLLLDGIAGTKFFFTFRFRHVWSIIRAHFGYYKRLGKLAKQRAELKKQLRNPNHKGKYKRSVVADFYLRGKKRFSDLNPEDFY